jgi:hypothetical protein
MAEIRRCLTCGQSLTQVGKFWVCPEHGQAAVGDATSLRIFLSYGHDANEELVRRIRGDLERRGHDVWFDKSEIRFGDDWRRSITDGILGSDRVLSFLSKHSVRDPGVCRDEIAIALGVKGGTVQTILVESEADVRPPVNVSHVQWLDMHDWQVRRDRSGWEAWYQAKLAEIVRVVESEESRRFAGEIEALNGHLKPIKSDARIYELLKGGFFGRAWLFDAVEAWRSSLKSNGSARGSRPFWITGQPGVGKSAFAAQLTQTRSDVVIAAQFIEWDKLDHRDPSRVVRSIAFQLATRLPDYRKLLLTLPEIAALDAKTPPELADYILADPLRTAIAGGRDQLVIVIDALDEAGDSERNPLVELLARLAPRLPDWLGIVATSRPESAVTIPLQGLDPVVLDAGAQTNLDDLGGYLRHALGAALNDRPDGGAIVEQVVALSEGAFLYVERFCRDLQAGHLSLDRPDQFPQGLGGIYHQWLRRQFPDVEQFKARVRPALRLMLAAREPLPVDIPQHLFNWSREQIADLVRALGSLFSVALDDRGRLRGEYHKSLADFLSDEARSGSYFVSVLDGHRQLADAGAARLSDTTSPMSAAEGEYWSRNLLYHLRRCGNWTGLVASIADPALFSNLWPGAYGLGLMGVQSLTNIWPQSVCLRDFAGPRYVHADEESLTEDALAELPEPLADDIPWRLAEAFADRTRELQLRMFAFGSERGQATNTIRRFVEGKPEFGQFRDMMYAFVDLARLAPAFAVKGAELRAANGRPDPALAERAATFDQKYAAIGSYIGYLAAFAINEGWSGAVEDYAFPADQAWKRLTALAAGYVP